MYDKAVEGKAIGKPRCKHLICFFPFQDPSMLNGWDNFFIMTGTAGATLTGLLFVVITLCIRLSTTRAAYGVHAFVTPTLVHFGGVLFQSLALLVPWPSAWPLGIILGLTGLAGLAYVIVVVRMLRRLDFVSLDLRDWIAYAGAPALANASLIAGAAGLIAGDSFAPYAVTGAITLLLFVGIHDAWDLTLWIIRNQDIK